MLAGGGAGRDKKSNNSMSGSMIFDIQVDAVYHLIVKGISQRRFKNINLKL